MCSRGGKNKKPSQLTLVDDEAPSQALLKILIIGSSDVGKSSLSNRFTANEFSETPEVTRGMDFQEKAVTIDKHSVKLRIWDTAGQERFRTITSSYYRGAHGIIVCFDFSMMQTWTDLKECWVPEMEACATVGCRICICGTKTDLPLQVPKEEVEAYCSSKGWMHFETSSKLNSNVTEMFQAFGKDIFQNNYHR